MRGFQGWLLAAAAAVGLGVAGAHAADAGPRPEPVHRHPLLFRLPPSPSDAISGLVGEYGTEQGLLVVFERGGGLWADGLGLQSERLVDRGGGRWGSSAGDLAFERGRSGSAVAVSYHGARLARVDLGAEAQARVRAAVSADPARLRASALAARPPQEPAPARPSELVALTGLDPTIKLDIRYATANNFMGIVLYERAGAWLQRPAAEAVVRANRSLRALGYGLLIHDAYRPWFVTWMFWEATPEQFHVFVANPANGSRHNRGAAVDLTLYDLRTGRAVEMPGRYDELSHRSYPDYVGGTSRQRALRDLLRREMEKQGFTVYPQEWWHFDYRSWRDYGIGNRTFSELERRPDA